MLLRLLRKLFRKRSDTYVVNESFDVSLPSQFCFTFLTRLLFLADSRGLVADDLYPLKERNQSGYLLEQFSNQELTKSKFRNSKCRISFWGLFRGCRWRLLGLFLAKLVAVVLSFLPTFFLARLLEYVVSSTSTPSGGTLVPSGLLWAFGIPLASIGAELLESQVSYFLALCSLRIQSLASTLVFEKLLKLSTESQNKNLDKVTNLLSSEAIGSLLTETCNLLFLPLQVALAFALVVQQLGFVGLSGLIPVAFVYPIGRICCLLAADALARENSFSQKRLARIREAFFNIKTIKLLTCERIELDEIRKLRDSQFRLLLKRGRSLAVNLWLFLATPQIAGGACIAAYALAGGALDAQKAFVTLSALGVLCSPLVSLQAAIPALFEAGDAISLFNSLMNLQELFPENKDKRNGSNGFSKDVNAAKETPSIAFNEAHYSNGSRLLLKDVTARFEGKALVAVIGKPGSGKTSLLRAIIGELHLVKGAAKVLGHVAYVPQDVFLINDTIKNNIVFKRPFDIYHLSAAVKLCRLEPELARLPLGLDTHLTAVPLSDGLKQKISLARALYSSADIYLFDDPFRALEGTKEPSGLRGAKGLNGCNGSIEPKATNEIKGPKEPNGPNGPSGPNGSQDQNRKATQAFFDTVIGNNGFLRDKLRIIVTNETSLLPLVDYIVVMNEGRVCLQGTFRSVKASLSEPGFDSRCLGSSGENCEAVNIETANKNTSVFKNANQECSEETKSQVISANVYKRFLASFGLCRAFLTLSLFAIASLCQLGSSVSLVQWTGLELSGQSPEQCLSLEIYTSLLASGVLVFLVAVFCLYRFALHGSNVVHNQVVTHLFRAPLAYFETTPLERLGSRLGADVAKSDICLPHDAVTTMAAFFQVVTAAVVVLVITPQLVVVVVPVLVGVWWLLSLYVAGVVQLRRLASAAKSSVLAAAQSAQKGAPVVRALGVVGDFTSDFGGHVDAIFCSRQHLLAIDSWLAIWLQLLVSLVLFCNCLVVVLKPESYGPALAGFCLTYAFSLFGNAFRFSYYWARLQHDFSGTTRCFQLLKTPLEKQKGINMGPEWPQRGTVQFDNYSCRFRPGMRRALKGVSFKIKAGEKVALVTPEDGTLGPACISRALFRLVEASGGKIYLDGKDIAKLDLSALRASIGIVPQETAVFGSVRFFLDPFDKFSDEEIWHALEVCDLKRLVSGRQGGSSHVLDSDVSGAQQQLFALARAVLRRPKVLIYEEAKHSERIHSLIKKHLDCTLLIVAQRLQTAMECERVVVLKEGRVVECGKPQALLQDTQSAFYSMSQKDGFEK